MKKTAVYRNEVEGVEKILNIHYDSRSIKKRCCACDTPFGKFNADETEFTPETKEQSIVRYERAGNYCTPCNAKY